MIKTQSCPPSVCVITVLVLITVITLLLSVSLSLVAMKTKFPHQQTRHSQETRRFVAVVMIFGNVSAVWRDLWRIVSLRCKTKNLMLLLLGLREPNPWLLIKSAVFWSRRVKLTASDGGDEGLRAARLIPNKENESFIHFPSAGETFILLYLHFFFFWSPKANLHFYSIINEEESHLHFLALFTRTVSGADLILRVGGGGYIQEDVWEGFWTPETWVYERTEPNNQVIVLKQN